MSYLAIMKVNADTNRVEKFANFPTQEEAEGHVQSLIGTYPQAYAVANPDNSSGNWLCDVGAKSISIDVVIDPSVAIREQLATDKANAKAKLIAGEALTEAEADTIVL